MAAPNQRRKRRIRACEAGLRRLAGGAGPVRRGYPGYIHRAWLSANLGLGELALADSEHAGQGACIVVAVVDVLMERSRACGVTAALFSALIRSRSGSRRRFPS